MSSHFAVGFAMGASLLVIIGLIAKLIGKRDFAEKLSYPVHVMSLLSLFALILACASAVIDFPTATFAASPWFRFKTTMAILSFFIYAAMYYVFMLKRQEVWTDNAATAYVVVLAIVGGLTISLLGAAGGYMVQGHSVLDFLLKAFGVPMPRA